jgi:branched-chain amino acid aminotransferase
VPITKTDFIWMDGELVNWDDANVHILTHTLHYGCGVFEGIRAYATAEGPGVFRLTDHIARLFNSAKIFLMDIPFTQEQVVEAVKHTVAANNLSECYIRPLAYLGYGEMGLNPLPCAVRVAIAVWPWGAYLGEEGIEKGVRVKISSWQRHDPNAMPPAAKGTGMYINSSMAKVEALKAGYDEAVLLSPQGYVSECTGENIFVIHDDRLLTPPSSAGALEGHHPGLGAHDRKGPWHRGGAYEHIAQRPLHRRRSVHERYRSRGGPHRLGRRPPGRGWDAGGGDPQDPGGL